MTPACEYYGLVVAAGLSRRFGRSARNEHRTAKSRAALKQFALLKGKPLITYSLVAFEQSRLVQSVVVVTNRARLEHVRRLADRFGCKKVSAITAGGRFRSDSVRNGIKHLPVRGCVAVHDAARPFVTSKMIDRGLQLCRRFGSATYGYPLSDTVKRVAHGQVLATVPREGLFAVQTPQFFPIELLRRAHEAAARKHIHASDDCALVELIGTQPRVITGSWANIKITGRQDLLLADRLL